MKIVVTLVICGKGGNLKRKFTAFVDNFK